MFKLKKITNAWNTIIPTSALVAGSLLSISSSIEAANYKFLDVTERAGVANETQGHFGAIWVDIDNNGLIDLYVVNDDDNVLYRNRGNGTFVDVTDRTRLGDPWVAMDNIAADYDHDGDQDIYSHNFGDSSMYENNGRGQYRDADSITNTDQSEPHGTGATWADLDNDGWLDMATTAFPGNNALYRNNGDGTFTEYLDGSGMIREAAVMGNTLGDIDKDGDMDWFGAAVTPQDINFFYLNNGDGTFTHATQNSGIIVEPGSSTAAVVLFDYDQDADLDFLLTEVSLGSRKQLPNRVYLFQNDGNGKFTDVTFAAGLDVALSEAPPRGQNDQEFWDAAAVDINNNGLLDIYLLTNHGANRLMMNNGDGTFRSAPEFGLDSELGGKGAAFGDMDNDGDLDVYLANREVNTQLVPFPNNLLKNTGGENNWLQLELKGTCSNFDAIGAKIEMNMNDGKTFYREVQGGRGLFSDDTRIVQVGLENRTRAAPITITWPMGHVQRLSPLDAGERYQVVEPACAP